MVTEYAIFDRNKRLVRSGYTSAKQAQISVKRIDDPTMGYTVHEVTTRQKLLFVEHWHKGPHTMIADPIPYTEPRPWRISTLYNHMDKSAPPALPFTPVHHQNAFFEDYVHDWNIHSGHLIYRSRVMDRPVWLLLEFKEPKS